MVDDPDAVPPSLKRGRCAGGSGSSSGRSWLIARERSGSGSDAVTTDGASFGDNAVRKLSTSLLLNSASGSGADAGLDGSTGMSSCSSSSGELCGRSVGSYALSGGFPAD